jgi:PEP-CTERM motif-containing protein
MRIFLFIAALLVAPSTFGATLVLHGTGFDGSGNPLTSSATSGGVDGSWTVAGGPAFFIAPGNADWWDGGGNPGDAYAVNGNAATFQGSGWVSNNAASGFNGPAPYTFSMTFNLSKFDIGTVAVSGHWSLADGGTLSVNGHVVSTLDQSSHPWTTLHAFSISDPSFLNSGQNTMSITVAQSDRFFEAARFEGSVTGSVVPEPDTYTLMLIGLGVISFAARRKLH